MRQPDPQPKMPHEKRKFFLVLLAIATLLLVGLIFAKALDPEKTSNTLVGVMTTLFIISAADLIPDFFRWLSDRSRNGKFRKFFGEMVIKDEVRFVFSYREVDPSVKVDPFITYTERKSRRQNLWSEAERAARPTPEGINGWLAFQDVEAAIYVSNMMSEMTGKQVLAVHDSEIEHNPKPYTIVSFGLGFNDFTHHAAGCISTPFFSIEMGPSPKKTDHLTDNFKVAGKDVPIEAGKDIAIIARIVPRPIRGRPTRAWFICAGRTAAGTSAAGFFLAHEWEQIFSFYAENDKDLLADSLVVVIQHNEYKSGGPGGPDYDATSEFATWIVGTGDKQKKEPVHAWGRAPGV